MEDKSKLYSDPSAVVCGSNTANNADIRRSFRPLPIIWKVLIICLLVLCVILLILVIVLAGKQRNISTADPPLSCSSSSPKDFQLSSRPNLFQDLTPYELTAAYSYLKNQTSLHLTPFDKATLKDNFVYTIELFLPKKTDALRYLDHGGPRPSRQARVIIFHGAAKRPFVREYLVGPLPKPSRHRILHLKHYKTTVPFYGRPFTFLDSLALVDIMRNVTKEAYPLLKESFGCWFHNCTNQCMNWLPVGMPARREVGKRYSWVNFNRDLEGRYLYTLPLQMLVEYSNADDVRILEVVYNNQRFDNVTQMMSNYERGKLEMAYVPVPTETQKRRSTLKRRGDVQPSSPKRGPTLVEPHGKRFTVLNNKVKYMNWQLQYGIRSTGGLALYDVRFRNQRIAYEVSVQEGVAYYSGYDPETSNTHYIDSNWGLGTTNTKLMKGIDCPENSVFLDSYHFSQTIEPVKNPNSVCIYETNTGTPLWRHHEMDLNKDSTGIDGTLFQGGMAGHALVVRVISTPFNYDYIFDYILHQNGVIEVKTTASGYIMPAFHTRLESKYGFVNFFNIVGTIHDHYLLHKVDLDVAGHRNSYETVDVVPKNVSYEWEKNVHRIKKEVLRSKKATEKDAILRYDFNKPKYYVFTNEHVTNSYGNPKGYRIDIQNKVKQLYSDGYYMNDVCSWSKYQLSVTKHSDLEPFGTSLYNQYMFSDPALNFDSMINDNESIENEDLVAWVTTGGLHIPNTEDIPLTNTVGSSYGFLIKPFGYFDEDPSLGSTNAVLLERGKDGKQTVNTYGTPEDSSCPVPTRKVWG